jgi:hypothetical protein
LHTPARDCSNRKNEHNAHTDRGPDTLDKKSMTFSEFRNNKARHSAVCGRVHLKNVDDNPLDNS